MSSSSHNSEVTKPATTKSTFRFLVIWFSVFTAIFVFDFLYRYLDDIARNRPGTFTVRLIEEITGVYSAAFLFLFVVKLTRHFSINRQNYLQRLPVHLLIAVVFSLLHTTTMAISRKAIFRLAGLGEYDYGGMPVRYLMEMANDLVAYAIWVTLIHLFDHYRESRERELRTAQLEAQLAQAQLQALQSQIHPHFLFNALNTISNVIYEDVQAADTMIARLSDFLRHTLNASRGQEVTLQEELNFLNLYLDIMRPRFEDRLQVDFDLEQGINDALVPKLILQPLIENSIKHAVNPTSGAVSISVKAARQNGSLLMQVKDDGPGLKTDTQKDIGNGLGLANTAERLDHLYGNRHEFDLRTANEGGLLVSIKVPYHTTTSSNGHHN